MPISSSGNPQNLNLPGKARRAVAVQFARNTPSSSPVNVGGRLDLFYSSPVYYTDDVNTSLELFGRAIQQCMKDKFHMPPENST